MQPVKEKDDRYMHSRLPIGANEKILCIMRHHWFAYASLWLTGLALVAGILGVAAYLGSSQVQTDPSSNSRVLVFAIAGALSALVLLFTMIPVYLRKQEQVVLTEEALLQILQPSLFASKISQLNLQHIADVSVRQAFLGTILGYGKISVETPGEQDNYEFYMIPNPRACAKEIIDAHENYQAALQAGRLPSSLGEAPVSAPQVDPQQYQQFLQYQQMVAQQKQAADGSASTDSAAATPEQPDQK